HRLQVGEVPRVGEGVERRHLDARVVGDLVAHEGRADEPGAARHQELHESVIPNMVVPSNPDLDSSDEHPSLVATLAIVDRSSMTEKPGRPLGGMSSRSSPCGRTGRSSAGLLLEETQQVLTVTVVAHGTGKSPQLRCYDVAHEYGEFLGVGAQSHLAVHNRLGYIY